MVNTSFKRIAITPEQPIDNEAKVIETILSHGWDMVHLRHPFSSRKELQNIIEGVSQEYHSRIRLHGHFDLLADFNLGGIHLNRRCPTPPKGYSGTYSRSCHSMEEVLHSNDCDYVTLSPVFDSVSKHGYTGCKFDYTDILQSDCPPVIALGGITPERIKTLSEHPFSGIAVLGYLFNDLPDANKYAELKKRLDAFSLNE